MKNLIGDMMNILLLSVGTRNKLVQYFKQNINGNVIATDMLEWAPALYEADSYYIVPAVYADNYFDTILEICKLEKINAILSLIDPELSILAKNRARFAQIGVSVIGSSYDLCEMAQDKMKMHVWLKEHNYNCAKTFRLLDDFYTEFNTGGIEFPVFVKPIRGSASLNNYKVYHPENIELLFKHDSELIIQEYLDGQEIGVDCYVDMISGELVSVFAKKKLRMRAGETDKSISFKDEFLFNLIERFLKETGFRGQIDIDLIEINGEYYILEVNPRFGGGYPHAHECGCNHIKMIENNVKGIVNEKKIGLYADDVVMMKYCDVLLIQK